MCADFIHVLWMGYPLSLQVTDVLKYLNVIFWFSQHSVDSIISSLLLFFFPFSFIESNIKIMTRSLHDCHHDIRCEMYPILFNFCLHKSDISVSFTVLVWQRRHLCQWSHRWCYTAFVDDNESQVWKLFITAIIH